MAKKIIISFDELPVIGNAFSYSITINGVKLIYNSGVDKVQTYFKSQLTDPVPPQSIQLKGSLNECVAQAAYVLKTYFVNSNVVYKVYGTTIEVLINLDNALIEFIEATGVGITVTTENIVTTTKLKYFLEYKNIAGDLYKCQIYQNNYTGRALQIFGTVGIEKGSAKDHLEPIRGTGLSLQLEANKDVTLEDLYTEDEQEFTVKLYVNNKIYFVGYLKPDGVYQSYTRDEWVINLDCIDGLGALSNLSFVDANGLHFIGKMNASDIVYNCLKRSGILLNINTSINILYEGLAQTDNLDILTKTYLNTDRFVKTDNETIMSCDEVLKSVLDIFCAVITQKSGEWYIYKPNELYYNAAPLFRRYDLNNVFIGTKKINLNSVLGSQIDNFYPHHSGANQRIDIKGGVSAFRVGYKYGFVQGLLNNNNFYHEQQKTYEFWTIDQTNKFFYIIDDILPNTGLKMIPDNVGVVRIIATSENVALNLGDSFNFKVSTAANGNATFYYKVRIGTYYMNNRGVWSTTASFINSFTYGVSDFGSANVYSSASFQSEPLPQSGNVYIEVYIPTTGASDDPFSATTTEVKSIDIVNTFAGDNKEGEFHTVQRPIKISSIIKENKEVFNGDNVGIVYNGALFKEDKITLSSYWFRGGFFESSPLLRIAAEEELRISQKPLKIFTGSVYGYLDYITVCKINNIDGKFMPIEWSYDTKNNVTSIKFLGLFAEEISDIKYEFTYDYGSTVKPTITG